MCVAFDEHTATLSYALLHLTVVSVEVAVAGVRPRQSGVARQLVEAYLAIILGAVVPREDAHAVHISVKEVAAVGGRRGRVTIERQLKKHGALAVPASGVAV